MSDQENNQVSLCDDFEVAHIGIGGPHLGPADPAPTITAEQSQPNQDKARQYYSSHSHDIGCC